MISRAIVEIFRIDAIARRLAWRGGTALHKLFLEPAIRYSEDLDLVQVDAEPIGDTLDMLRATREHFTECGLVTMPFEVQSRWFQGTTNVTTFPLEGLLGTKLRALYQRRKGRGLFDLWTAARRAEVSADRVVRCFERYMLEGGHSASRAQCERNLAGKREDRAFRADIEPLLRPGRHWDFEDALDFVLDVFVSRLAGEPWRSPRECT